MTITIFAYSRYAAEFQKKTLQDIFGEQIKIDIWLVSEHEEEIVETDAALILSDRFYNYVMPYLKEGTPSIVANYTIEKSIVEKIKRLSKNDHLSVMAETRITAIKSWKNLLVNLGIKRERLEIADVNTPNEQLSRYVIFFGDTVPERLRDHEIIHIPLPVLSISSIVEIALALNLDIFQNHMIKDYCEKVGVSKTINDGENIFRENSKGMMTGEEDIVIDFNAHYSIINFNEAAAKLFGFHEEKQVFNKKIWDMIPFLADYNEKTISEFGEQVVEYDQMLYTVCVELYKVHGLLGGEIHMSGDGEKQKRYEHLEDQLNKKNYKTKYTFSEIIGNSDKMRRCKEVAMRMAACDENILIQGQSGVGKEMFAQAIHSHSMRKDGPFVTVNCGAFADSLLERELFGYEDGAFAGVRKGGKKGAFERANKGTLFLDEIGEMPIYLQTRLIRVLQEKEIVRVDGSEGISIDVRIIAASNQDLRAMVPNKTFRSDLYYRLNVLPLKIPSLKERKEDIPLLMTFFKEMKHYSYEFTTEAMEYMKAYPYEGNVRELENCLAYLNSAGKNMIQVSDLPDYMQEDFEMFNVKHIPEQEEVLEEGHDRGVLRAIGDINRQGQGAGRQRIKEWLFQRELIISEMEIRHIVDRLRDDGLIDVTKGRGGCKITQKGKRILGNGI